jgi:hypothetical protein
LRILGGRFRALTAQSALVGQHSWAVLPVAFGSFSF